jgi:hypothetical protein
LKAASNTSFGPSTHVGSAVGFAGRTDGGVGFFGAGPTGVFGGGGIVFGLGFGFGFSYSSSQYSSLITINKINFTLHIRIVLLHIHLGSSNIRIDFT